MTKQTKFEETVEFWGKRLNEETTCSLNSNARKLKRIEREDYND